MDFDWPDDYTVEKRIGIATTQPSEALDVIGNISATGDISATNLNLNGSLTINQNLTVSGNFQLGTLSVKEFSSDGNLADNSNLAVPTEQAVKTYVDNQINTRAALNGASNQDFATNNLSVDESLTVNNAITTKQLSVSDAITGSLTVENNLTVNNAIATKQLSVSGSVTGSLTVENDLTVNNAIATKQLSVSGSVTGSLTVENDLTVNNAIAASSFSVTANANIGGNLKVDGNLEVMGDVTARDVEHVSGNVSFGDADDDEVKITGMLRSGHSSGALRVDDALHTTGSLTIDSKVGIGTTNPQDKLDLNGVLRFNGNGNRRVYGDSRAGSDAVVLDGRWDELEVKGRVIDWTGSNFHIGYQNDHSNHSLYIGNGKLKTVAIQGNTSLTVGGNVGIGTTTPEAKLDIIPSGSQPWLKMGSGGDSGRLWVEYGSHDAPLIVLSDFDDPPRIRFQQMGTQTEADPEFHSWIGHAKGLSSDLAIMGGNVGIGTNNPKVKLEVSGDIQASGKLSSQNGRVKRDFVSWNHGITWPDPINKYPIHIKTNIPKKSNIMYRILVEGYNYGVAAAINSDVVGYTYHTWENIGHAQANNYANGISISQYYSSDGYVVIKLTTSTTYFLGFSASAWFTNPAGNSFDISATVHPQAGDL